MLRTTKITAAENDLAGKYRPGETLVVSVDGASDYSLYLPDATGARDVVFLLFPDSQSGTVTVTPRNSQTIDGDSTKALSGAMLVVSDGENWKVQASAGGSLETDPVYLASVAAEIDADDVSNWNSRGFCLAAYESSESVAVADGAIAFTIPAILNGLNLTAAIASVHTKGVTGTTDVQIRRRRAGTDVDMLSTKITIGDEYHASDGVIDTDNDDVATGDQIYVDVDAVHSGTAPKGLSVALTFGS
jgi:hypothetical protein